MRECDTEEHESKVKINSVASFVNANDTPAILRSGGIKGA